MHRKIVTTLLILFCCYNFSYAEDISIEELIRGINKNRIKILSGEVYSKTTNFRPASKTEEEIAEWMKTEKKKRISEYTPLPPDQDVDVKQYETEHLIPYLNSWANRYREHTETELTTTIFRVLNPDDEKVPRQNQYKVTVANNPGHPIDRMSELYIPSDNIYLLAFDTRTQVKQRIGNIVFSSDSTSSISFYDSNYHYGYRQFAMFGRSPYRVPSDAKEMGKEKIDGVDCHIITYTSPKGLKVRMWVDPEKDFAVHQYELLHPTRGWYIRNVYKAFKKYGNLSFPEIYIGTTYSQDGSLRNRYTVEVIDAEFNVSFPEDFFDIDKDFYKSPHSMFNQ
ncbi:MAG: hypothetical protein OXU23_28345 [Candidatus Poribacteria bacterium]|nr:hypothetical protein [Candidatus Poribacteria bacterium]